MHTHIHTPLTYKHTHTHTTCIQTQTYTHHLHTNTHIHTPSSSSSSMFSVCFSMQARLRRFTKNLPSPQLPVLGLPYPQAQTLQAASDSVLTCWTAAQGCEFYPR